MGTKREKHVFKTEELAHIWAQQKQADGRNAGRSNFYFSGPTIYSYGSHFPIATFIKPKIVLFTLRRYSNTTAKHIGMARHAIPHDCTVFYVKHLFPGTLENHKENIADYQVRVSELLEKAIKSRKYSEHFTNEAQALYDEALAYHAEFKIRAKIFAFPAMGAITEKIKKQKIAAKKDAEKRRLQAIEDAKIKTAEMEFSMLFGLPAWKKGIAEIPYCAPGYYSAQYGEKIKTENCMRIIGNYGRYSERIDFLRIKKESKTRVLVETSRGVTVFVKNGKIADYVTDIYNRCKQCAETKTTWKSNGESISIDGQYSVSSIDADGLLTAGCHRIPLSEIEEIYQQLQKGV